MKTRDIPARRLSDLEHLSASKAEQVSIYGSDLRTLLELRREAFEHIPEDFLPEEIEGLARAARDATTTSARVKVSPEHLTLLLRLRDLLAVLLAEQAHRAVAESVAESAAGAREIQSHADDGASRRTVLVGPDHGSKRPSVRTYGFDLEHLAGFLELHPETVRQAIREGELVPTDLGSIYTFKRKRDGRTKVKVAKGGAKL